MNYHPTPIAQMQAEIKYLRKELARAKAAKPPRIIKRVSKADLLLAASQKGVRYVIQLDIFLGGGDSLSDVDGDGLYAGTVAELRNTDCTRIQLPVGINHADALRCIDKLRDWAANAPELFDAAVDPEPECEAPF